MKDDISWLMSGVFCDKLWSHNEFVLQCSAEPRITQPVKYKPKYFTVSSSHDYGHDYHCLVVT